MGICQCVATRLSYTLGHGEVASNTHLLGAGNGIERWEIGITMTQNVILMIVLSVTVCMCCGF